MSTAKQAEHSRILVEQLRQFIAGTILFNQKVADRVGLHLTDTQCLNLLELFGPSTPGQLSRLTGLTTGGVTVMLDRLEKAGYIKREPNPGDRRSLLVRVLPKKAGKLHSYYEEINERMGSLWSATPEAELEVVIDFFQRMNATRLQDPPAESARRVPAKR